MSTQHQNRSHSCLYRIDRFARFGGGYKRSSPYSRLGWYRRHCSPKFESKQTQHLIGLIPGVIQQLLTGVPSAWFPLVRSTHLLLFAQVKRLLKICGSLEIAYCALKAVTYIIWKLLVVTVESTCPYLKSCAIYIATAFYVQAFVSKCLNSPFCEDPFLSCGTTASLYSDSRSIVVWHSCQAFGCIQLPSLNSRGWLLMKNMCLRSNLAAGEVHLWN